MLDVQASFLVFQGTAGKNSKIASESFDVGRHFDCLTSFCYIAPTADRTDGIEATRDKLDSPVEAWL
ncbi:hypothetical protein [Microcoleus sp. BROC3]|uniref:hypothetical protein n=1 Tax=Microcoleus sp. BROC3 TaxID=3055323 RepID=UPI002FCFF367